MINNRQANNGRRRGRGGQRSQGGGNPNQGNRIDSRARGNAAQLLEKYKNLARDAQMQGDRVNTEYYLQFADHYFRVLAETRSRFEEQNPGQQHQGRRPSTDIDLYDEEFEGEGAEGPRGNEGEPVGEQQRVAQDGYGRGDQRPEPREARRGRDDRPRDERPRDERPREERQRDERPREERSRDDRPRDDRQRDELPREDRPREDRQRTPRARNERRPVNDVRAEAQPAATVSPPMPTPTPANEDDAPAVEQPRRRGRPRREAAVAEANDIAAVLPPALGVEAEVVAEVKPRRRRVKKDEGEPEAAE